jgi:hypothetical protein
MKGFVRRATTVVAVAGFSTIASAAFADQPTPFVGTPGVNAYYNRVITISPAAKWVNVTQGETIKFVDAASGKSFVWTFDTPSWAVIHLDQLPPAQGLGGHKVDAYIQLDANLNSGC